MKKNMYFQTVFRRENLIKSAIYDMALKSASYPKLLIEVFIRKNFGERYFKMSSVVTFAVLMVLLPFILGIIGGPRSPLNSGKAYITWFLFMFAFIIFSIVRWIEVKRNPSTLDFARFSLYSGDIHPFFQNSKIFGQKQNVRMIETYVEPAPFFILGVVLLTVGQYFGYALIFASMLYSMSYAAQYSKGDDFIMDKIDEIIMNEELENAFVNDQSADQTRGVRFYSRKPNKKAMRQKLADSFIVETQPAEEITYAE